MKILTLGNNLKESEVLVLNKGVTIIKDWCKPIGLVFDFSFTPINKQFSSLPFSNETSKDGHMVNSQEIFVEGKAQNIPFDIVCLVYSWLTVKPQPTNPVQIGQMMQIPLEWYNGYAEVFAEFFLHELCHYFFGLQGKQDITHNYDIAFGQLPRKDWYLFLLKDLIKENNTMPIKQVYKYFSQKEVDGWKLTPELFSVLDKMREIAGTPFIITSGFRTIEQNKLVGGVSNSAHLRGKAVDIVCTDNTKRTMILKGIYSCGIPTFVEIATKHIHISIDTSINTMGQTIVSNLD